MKFKFFLVILAFILPLKTSYAEWIKIPPNNTFLTSLETSPWGILIGEFDTRIYLNPPPLNAIYFSQDLGQNWKPVGLEGRAITNIKFFEGKIYATTYYVKNGTSGLFVTSDLGNSWKHIGPNFSLNKTDRDSRTIYVGGDNRGLWVSLDEGENWVQKLGESGYGPNIKSIKSFENITFVSTIDKTYKSIDHGNTWEEITSLDDKGIVYFCSLGEGVYFAGSSGTLGIYKSTNNGYNWSKINAFGNYSVGDLLCLNGKIYAGRVNPFVYDTYTILESSDLGETWKDIYLNVPSAKRVLELAWLFTKPEKLYALSLNNGLYKYEITESIPESLPLLSAPWKNSYAGELLDKITSFFDHRYPLLGYLYKKEETNNSNTTLNYLGDEKSEPEIYYSSHNGYDYGLPYGTNILAAADGTASYYYCSACGNSIKITHPNGYRTIYMHLQKTDLITLDGNVNVISGDVIGKVGMTGNTNGPHLHFQVSNGSLYPDNITDPYGWAKLPSSDPWAQFKWEDQLGTHAGTSSINLWINSTDTISKLIVGSGNIDLDNKSVTWGPDSINSKTVLIRNYIRPTISTTQSYLAYVPNTSFKINSYDFLGNEIISFSEPVEIKIKFSENDLKGIDQKTLKIYFLNVLNSIWEPLPTILDLVSYTASATTNHFSHFAIFGEKINRGVPETIADILGPEIDGWFTEYPTVSLTVLGNSNPNIEIFYTTEGESGWEKYQEPFIINRDGIINLQYRSMDEFSNIEPTQNKVLKINTVGNKIKVVKIKDTSFFTE